MSNCKNCGAPRKREADECPYCGTVFYPALSSPSPLNISCSAWNVETYTHLVANSIITPNEARAMANVAHVTREDK